jgi:hypothetical protein
MMAKVEQAAEEAAVILDHMLEIPMGLFVVAVRLFVVMRHALLVLVHQAAVADLGAAIALFGQALAAAAAIAHAGFVHEAVVLAMPAFQLTIMVAPPFAMAAVVGAAPPAEIDGAETRAMHVVAIARAIPAVPAAVRAAMQELAIVFAVTVPVVAVVELNLGHGIEGIEQHGIGEGDAGIFVGAARFSGVRAERHEEAQGEQERPKTQMPHEMPSPVLARRSPNSHHGDLLNDGLRDWAPCRPHREGFQVGSWRA